MQAVKKSNPIKEKSFGFALRVIHLYKYLKEKNEYVMCNQLLRCGTSIGALVSEAEHAESKADFIHKMAIAQKEANETDYWIELLHRSEYIDVVQYESVSNDIKEIQKILSSIIITAKRNR